ncbi:MAG: FAD-dependent oxidoreductase [Firmicutes bacterium]|jgi:glycine/D-amino acid oxidase-like deaminating enzyme|nr:FAD-dependent oxidoreductase [Bacillota bacterium]HQD40581.1 FAD-dependent oxidoreductase [Bacillota bacterium]
MHSVIVVGGGPAGVAAAVAAKREGQSVLLIERYGFLGGMATAGLVNPFMVTLGAGGLYQEFLERLEKWDARKDRTFDGELTKLVLDEWLQEEGVDILFHGLLTDAEVEGGYIKSIKVVGKGEELEFAASYFIDCTGDGDLAKLAGVPMNMGREADGLCQPMTTCFQVGGVDDELMLTREELTKLYLEAKAQGKLNNPRENLLWFRTIRPGEVHFNTTRVVGKNPVSLQELTEAELEARRQLAETFAWLKKEVPAFKNAYIMRIAAQIGVRESRTIQGAYQLTEDDVLSCRKFDDAIGKCSYPIDIHSPQGEGTRIAALPKGEWYEIPYRTLYSPAVENLLVAGRCISSTHEAQASLRIMPTCMVMGQAAGVAAAMASAGNLPVSQVPVPELQAKLKAKGADLR